MNVKRKIRPLQWLGLQVLFLCLIIVLAFLGLILWNIFWHGAAEFSVGFVFRYPEHGMTAGGIFPAVAGTVLVTLLTAVISVPLGVITAIYLNEYASDTWTTRAVRAAVRNLSGVPSIIYGLFGVAIFVEGLHMGTSLLASGFTLGLLTLPYIITTTEEALKTVPQAYREGAAALGAGKWFGIRTVVLPSAIPGILTGVILSISRAAGETAPILFTGVVFYQRFLPASVFDEFMALPYHVFILSTQHHAIDTVRPLAYATAMVLLIVILILNLLAFIIRYRYRHLTRHQ